MKVHITETTPLQYNEKTNVLNASAIVDEVTTFTFTVELTWEGKLRLTIDEPFASHFKSLNIEPIFDHQADILKQADAKLADIALLRKRNLETHRREQWRLHRLRPLFQVLQRSLDHPSVRLNFRTADEYASYEHGTLVVLVGDLLKISVLDNSYVIEKNHKIISRAKKIESVVERVKELVESYDRHKDWEAKAQQREQAHLEYLQEYVGPSVKLSSVWNSHFKRSDSCFEMETVKFVIASVDKDDHPARLHLVGSDVELRIQHLKTIIDVFGYAIKESK